MRDFFTTGHTFHIATVDSSCSYDLINGIVIIVCINHHDSTARGRTYKFIDHDSHSFHNLNGVSRARQSSEIKKGCGKYRSASCNLRVISSSVCAVFLTQTVVLTTCVLRKKTRWITITYLNITDDVFLFAAIFRINTPCPAVCLIPWIFTS